MDGHQLLKNVYVLNIYIQELVAIVAKTFALNHKCLEGESRDDPDVAFSKVLCEEKLNIKKFASDKKFKLLQSEIFQNGKSKNPLNTSINATRLDSAFLLSLMLNTDFLDISHKDGTCASKSTKHQNKCCVDCNHEKQRECSKCQSSKKTCDGLSKICCNEDLCQLCISCTISGYKKFHSAAMKGIVPPNHYKYCPISVVKETLSHLLNFRNLFHLTAALAKDFTNGLIRLEKFPEIKTTKELLLHMNIMCSTLFSLVKNNRFKHQVASEEIEEIQKTIDCIFVDESILDQLLKKNLLKTIQEKFNFSNEQFKMIGQNYSELSKRVDAMEKKQGEMEEIQKLQDKRVGDLEEKLLNDSKAKFDGKKKYNLEGRYFQISYLLYLY